MLVLFVIGLFLFVKKRKNKKKTTTKRKKKDIKNNYAHDYGRYVIRGTNTASGCENRRIGRRFPPRARKKKEKKTETTFYPAPNNYPTREFLPSISISRACKSRTTQHKTENLLNRWSTRGFARIVANSSCRANPPPLRFF